MIEQAIEFFFPWLFKRIDTKYSKDRRRGILLNICAFGFVVASFEAFDDKTMQLRKFETQVLTSSRQIIHIKSGENFEDSDTADKLILIDTVKDKPTTIGLPKNPRIDQTITITDKGGIAIYAQITVFGNGNKIIGLDKYVIQVNHLSAAFTYTGSDWIVK